MKDACRARVAALALEGIASRDLGAVDLDLRTACFLKWARFYGVAVRWRLAEAPERPERFRHLPPPDGDAAWRGAWERVNPPALELRRGAGFAELTDTRSPDGRWESVRLIGAEARAYAFCEDPRSTTEFLAAGGRKSWLAAWRERGWLLSEGETHLSLALPYRRDRPAAGGWLKLYKAGAI